jgi:hypothetical protein
MNEDGPPLKDVIAILHRIYVAEQGDWVTRPWKLYTNAKLKTKKKAQKQVKRLRAKFGIKFWVDIVQTPMEEHEIQKRKTKEQEDRVARIAEQFRQALEEAIEQEDRRRRDRLDHWTEEKEKEETAAKFIRVTDEGEIVHWWSGE